MAHVAEKPGLGTRLADLQIKPPTVADGAGTLGAFDGKVGQGLACTRHFLPTNLPTNPIRIWLDGIGPDETRNPAKSS